MKKLVVLGDYERVFPDSPKITLLESLGFEVITHHQPIQTDEEIVSLLKDVEVVVLVRERVPLTTSVLKQLPRLKMISQTGGGAAHIDLKQVEKQGIKLTLTGSTSLPSVVELTIGLMIACARQFPRHHEHFKQDKWVQFPGIELRGKQLGLLGYGKIAREVAHVAQSLGMYVVAWRPTGKRGDEPIPVLELDELLATSDVVSVHLKLVPELVGVLNRERLSQMKQGSILINTARGALIDTDALIDLLKAGHLFGAGIDTFAEEPLTENPFKDCPNVVLTPHIGYVTTEVLQRFAEQSLQNVIDVYQSYNS